VEDVEDELVVLQRTLYESRNATRRWLHTTRREWISQAVRKFCPGRERALEIGPGSGIYIPVLKEVCAEVYVTDCERAYLRPIESRYAGNAAVKIDIDDITKSHLPSDYFDLVLCTEVVEHIADSSPAFKHIARVLKPDGVLILSTPQRHSSLELTAKLALSRWLIWLTRFVYREAVLEMGHINLMSEREVRAQITAADLCIIECHKSGLYLPGIAELCGSRGQRWAARLEPLIRGSRFDGVLWTQYYVVARASHGQSYVS
jgi:SAM-dependent methyltransferase